MTKWWNLADTRGSEPRAFAAWEFDSPLGHCSCRRAGARPALIRLDGPARYRGLQLTAEYANRQSGQVESLVIDCGFNSHLGDCGSERSAGKTGRDLRADCRRPTAPSRPTVP